MMGLPAYRFVAGDAEPGQILLDRRRDSRPAALLVDILKADQEAPGVGGRQAGGEPGRIGVPEMQAAGRAGRETGGQHGLSKNLQDLAMKLSANRSITGCGQVSCRRAAKNDQHLVSRHDF